MLTADATIGVNCATSSDIALALLVSIIHQQAAQFVQVAADNKQPMKKPKKQKKPSYKSLAFDYAKASNYADRLASELNQMRRGLEEASKEVYSLKHDLEQARYARENKMKQLGIYFAALDNLPCGHERLIQLQDELFDRLSHTVSTGGFIPGFSGNFSTSK